MTNFITNDENKNLKKRLMELISKSKELKFLVGFFYFSGVSELYESLRKNDSVKLRILVGLNVDILNFKILTEYERSSESRTKDTEAFLESLRKSLNAETFDTKEFYEQIIFFLEMIDEGRLILRKTKDPNHAKVYIFELQDQTIQKNLFITGSSNLTKAGISTQDEFNVEIKDYGTDEADEYFETLWNDSIEITENEEIKKRLLDVIKNKTHIKEINPFQAFALVLKTYLDSYAKEKTSQLTVELMTKGGYKPYKYQLDAIGQAKGFLKEYGGVILADVVGLGKSVIASALAKEMGKRGVILCPPGLTGDESSQTGWWKYKEDFELNDWKVMSSGNLRKASKHIKNRNIEIVIIDEVHRFRNSDTRDYEILRNICRGKQVILLTATPFNNSPSDILSLLQLFIVPKKSSLTLNDDLKNDFRIYNGKFRKLSEIKRYHNSVDLNKKNRVLGYYRNFFNEEKIDLQKVENAILKIAQEVRTVIEPVTVRRNRLDLQVNVDYQEEVKDLPEVQPPEEWFYELTSKQMKFYDEILTEYFSEEGKFTGAIYQPFIYEKGLEEMEEDMTGDENREFISQKNLFDFMRRLVVKRFESSFGSFEQSIRNFKRVTENVLSFIESSGNKYILDRDLMEKIYQLDEDQINKALIDFEKKLKEEDRPKNDKIYEIDEFVSGKEFIEDIRSDLKMYEEILEKMEKLKLKENDPKAQALVESIQKELKKKAQNDEPKRKIIIFSEYADTVKHLQPILESHFSNKVLTIEGVLSRSKVDLLYENFDAGYENQEDDYDILLSTDKISEGFNLNRAGTIINYDIPWNPVRVIQRVGRINRIGKKVFNKLFIVNFFPTEQGAEYVQSREIAAGKMFMIHNILGEDAQIFDVDEEITPANLYKKLQADPDEKEETFYTKVHNKFSEIKNEHPESVKDLETFPPRVKVAKKGTKESLLVFIKKGPLYVEEAVINENKEIDVKVTTLENVYDEITCEKDEEKLKLSDDFWDRYSKAKEYRTRDVSPRSEQSIEVKASNMLNSLLRQSGLEKYQEFLETLREDMDQYETLAFPTLRRIVKLSNENMIKLKKEIDDIQEDLGGENYLETEKQKTRNIKKELIIAIENRIK